MPKSLLVEIFVCFVALCSLSQNSGEDNLQRIEDGAPSVDWVTLIEKLGEIFNKIESASENASSIAAESQHQLEQEREKSAAIAERAATLAERMEDTLCGVEARMTAAKATWEREAKAGERRRQDDHDFMLEQVTRWEDKLVGAIDRLEAHKAQHVNLPKNLKNSANVMENTYLHLTRELELALTLKKK